MIYLKSKIVNNSDPNILPKVTTSNPLLCIFVAKIVFYSNLSENIISILQFMLLKISSQTFTLQHLTQLKTKNTCLSLVPLSCYPQELFLLPIQNNADTSNKKKSSPAAVRRDADVDLLSAFQRATPSHYPATGEIPLCPKCSWCSFLYITKESINKRQLTCSEQREA